MSHPYDESNFIAFQVSGMLPFEFDVLFESNSLREELEAQKHTPPAELKGDEFDGMLSKWHGEFVEKFENKCDWEDLRARVVANGGIRNSALVNYMPGESSSKAMGLVNAIYPAREATLIKTDNSVTTYWAAPNSDDPAYKYEWAWDIPSEDMVAVYSIFQKFTDQGISADLWVKVIGDQKISSDDMLGIYFMKTKYGMKTRYYQNVLTTEGVSIGDDTRGCAGGSCTL
jgi:ribonucleoside-diphosphate reductase alpha chain